MKFHVLLAVAVLAVSGSASADPVLSKVSCTGHTTDNQAVSLVITVNAGAAQAVLTLGTAAAKTYATTVTESSGQDVSNRTVYFFKATLDPVTVFGARSFDFATGTGALELAPPLRAPMLSCAFTH